MSEISIKLLKQQLEYCEHELELLTEKEKRLLKGVEDVKSERVAVGNTIVDLRESIQQLEEGTTVEQNKTKKQKRIGST
jgi:uncharacterized protein YoxC